VIGTSSAATIEAGHGPPHDLRTPVVVRSLQDARDRDLVRRLVARDEDAFLALFARYGPPAKGLAYRLVRDAFLAEEIVQEAFLALWRDPASYREERGPFRTWLMSTVHHRAVDMVRREEAQRRRSSVAERGEVGDVAERVAEDLDTARERERVRAALEDLPAEQRRVLEMMYFEAKTQSMIAEELDLPLGTVKGRTLLGMRRLRSMLLGNPR
jgi:RNA polymerase sigma factor (sigma-70 family)